MRIALPKTLPPATILDELFAAMAECEKEYQRSPRALVLAGELENKLWCHAHEQSHALTLAETVSSRDRKEAERQGELLCRLYLKGVPCLSSELINALPEKPPEDLEELPEEEVELYQECWVIALV